MSLHTRREVLLELQGSIRHMGAELENRELRNSGAKIVQEAGDLVRKPSANVGNKAVRGGQAAAKHEYRLVGGMFGQVTHTL